MAIAAPASPADDVAAYPVRHTGLLITAIMGASIIQFLDATIAHVAIPHMQTSLGASFDSVVWVLTSFIIATAVATPITGWAAERLGSRNLMLLAVGGFIIASMLCGAATSLGEMVAFRILQGVTAAFIGPVGQTIMLDVTPPSKHARAMSLWGMAVMLGPIFGPMLGGWLTENLNWRWVFYVNLPIGIPTFLILWWLLPSRPKTKRPLDGFGFITLALGLAMLQLMLDRGQHKDWFESPEIVIEFIIAVSLIWVFTVHSLTAKNPLFDRALILDRNFLIVMGYMIVMGVVMIGLSALLPPLLQNIYGYPVYESGLLTAPRGVGVLAAMIINSRLVGRVDLRWPIGIGYVIGSWSLWMMTGWSTATGEREIIIAGLVQGLGMGLTFMPVQMIAFANLPMRFRTDGSSLMNLMRSVGGSLGISLITTILARNMQTSHADLSQHVTPYNIPGVDLSATAERLGSAGEAGLRVVDGMIQREAAIIAYLGDFKLMAIITLFAVPLALLLKAPKGMPRFSSD